MKKLALIRIVTADLRLSRKYLATSCRLHHFNSSKTREKIGFVNFKRQEYDKFRRSFATEENVRIFSNSESTELFPDLQDDSLKKISAIGRNELTIDSGGTIELFNALNETKCEENVHRSCQIFVSLHNLAKLNRHNRQIMGQIKYDEKLRELLNKCVKRIETEINDVSSDILINVLHSLKRLEFPQRATLPEKLLEHCIISLPKSNPVSLIYLSICLNSGVLKYVPYQIEVLNILQDIVNNNKTYDDLKWTALCLRNLIGIVSDSIVEQFFHKTIEIVTSNSRLPPDVAFACLRVASQSVINNRDILLLLLNEVKDSIDELSLYQLGALKTLLKNLDADVNDVRIKISRRALELLKFVTHPLDKFELIHCLDEVHLQKIRTDAIQILNDSYSMIFVPFHGNKLFSILKNLKYVNNGFLNHLCGDIVKHLRDEPSSVFVTSIVKSYMKFVFGFNGVYTNEDLELELQNILLQYLQRDWGLFAREVACVSAFFILTYKKQLPKEVVERTLAHSHHFSSGEILSISESLRFALRNKTTQQHRMQLETISDELNRHMPSYLSSSNLSLVSLCQHVSANLYRSGIVDNYLLDDAMAKYNNHLNDFTSKTLITTSKNIAESRYFAPEIIDAMVEYVLKTSDVTGWAISLLLFACYETAYFPKLGDEFLDYSLEILKRDYDHLTGLKLLQAAMAFGLFNRFPSFFVSNIFTANFLDRLDRDLQISWSSVFAFKVRNYLMNVNRVICIEYPEFKVPWFHETYCQGNVSRSLKSNSFVSEVESVLSQVLGGSKYFNKNVYTAYYYPLNFECILDSRKRPVILDPEEKNKLIDDPQFQRIVMITLPENVYCSNARHLRGSEHLKRRHLEIMNYKVVDISHFEWNSLYMSDVKSRYNLLKKKIFE